MGLKVSTILSANSVQLSLKRNSYKFPLSLAHPESFDSLPLEKAAIREMVALVRKHRLNYSPVVSGMDAPHLRMETYL